MAVSTDVQYAALRELFLDPTNPRLGRARVEAGLSQSDILDVMIDWSLEELAVSYLEGGGFWTYESLVVVSEELYGETKLVVVEGNRRLAALQLLLRAYEFPHDSTRKWRALAESTDRPPALFERIPYLLADSRSDVAAFLGFRHVTGIKEWHPAEKAAYIAQLVDSSLTYQEVMRKIGSKTPTVRKQYIAHRLQRQIEEIVEEVAPASIEDRFSVMYLSLRTRGVQEYLGLNIEADEADAKTPVPAARREQLRKYAVWMFGTESKPPLFSDSRMTDRFGGILGSEDALEYLSRNERPSFDLASQLAGGEEPEITEDLGRAADAIELALSRVHLYQDSTKIIKVVKRLAADLRQLLTIFPALDRGTSAD